MGKTGVGFATALVILAACGAGHRAAVVDQRDVGTLAAPPTTAALVAASTTSSLPASPATTSQSAPPGSLTPPVRSTTTTTTSQPAPTAGEATYTEADNGHVVTVRRGTRITVILHNTYWTFDHGSDPAVLRFDGSETQAQPPGSGCVAGQGCGTVTARFTAVGTGRATIGASRTSCGEAMACQPGQGTYVVTVNVT